MQARFLNLLWAGTLTLVLLLGRIAVFSPLVALLFTFLLLVTGAWWLFALHRSGLEVAATPFDGPLISLTLVWVITSLLSVDPVRSFRLVWSWLAVLSGFYIFLTFFRLSGERDRFFDIVSLVLLVFIGFGALEIVPQLAVSDFSIRAVERVYGLTGSPNILGFFLATGSLIQIDRLLKKKGSVFFSAIWLVGGLTILLFTQSRSAALALTAGVMVLWIAPRLAFERSSIGHQVAIGIITFFAASAGVLALLYFIRPAGILEGTGGVRLILWETAIDNWWSSPIFGTGLDTFSSANLLANRPLDTPLFLRAAHSLWLELLSGTGLLGGAAAAWLGVVLTRTIWHQRHLFYEYALPMAVGGAFLVHATLDTPEPWTLFLVGSIVAAFPWPEAAGRQAARYFPAAVWLLVVASGLSAYSFTRHYEAGLALAEIGDWAAAAAAFDDATKIGPYHDSAALLAAGLTHATAGQSGEAINRFERLIDQEPGWPGNYVNLAFLYQTVGRDVDAASALANAGELAPNNDVIRLNTALFANQPSDPQPTPTRHPFWRAAAGGDWERAESERASLTGRQIIADGVLALANQDLTRADQLFNEAVRLDQTLDAELWRLWVDMLEEDPDGLAAETESLLASRSLLGISPAFSSVYPQTVLGRRGLPIDLVPGPWCRVSHPTIDLYLTIVDQWLSLNRPSVDTEWIDAWQMGTHPEVEGLVECNQMGLKEKGKS